MKIAMLYRARSRVGDGVELAPALFVRCEIIEVDGDLVDGLDHVRALDGESFINCVEA